jgi:hypothetical protein
MMSFLERYRERMIHTHGWDVPLTCNRCGREGPVNHQGFRPSLAVNFGQHPTIYSLVSCTSCGKDLRKEAGDALVALFKQVKMHRGNGRLISLGLVGLASLLIIVLLGSAWLGSAMVGVLGLLGPLIMVFNYKVAGLRYRCGCAEPAPKFMGLLGRSYCYRCSNCGNLIRLRD